MVSTEISLSRKIARRGDQGRVKKGHATNANNNGKKGLLARISDSVKGFFGANDNDVAPLALATA